MAGVIEATENGVSIEIRPEDFNYPRISDAPTPQFSKKKDFRVSID